MNFDNLPAQDAKPGFARRSEDVQWRSSTTVEKFSADQVAFATKMLGHEPTGAELALFCGAPEEGVHVDPTSNLLTTAGLGRITSLILGAGGQAATATATRLGVGNSSTAATTGDTDLAASSGSTNRQFYIMDSTFPSSSSGVLTFKSTFASSDANFVWNEWCVDVAAPTVANGTTVGTLMLNRKVASLGTKASGSSWALTASITLS